MLDAIIIAGSPNTGPLRECSGEAYEAMITIKNKPMVRYVVDALLDSKRINKIAIAGPAELKKVFPEENIFLAESTGSILGNVVKAIELVDHSKPFMLATCDIPLLTAEAVADFINLSRDQDVDFFYSVVSMDEVNRCFPGVRRTSATLKEGTFTGGNLFIANPAVVPQCAARAQEFVDFRKSPLKLSRLLGLKFVIKLLFKKLSIPELEQKVSALMGVRVKAIPTLYPEIGIDLDKPSDYEIITEFLEKQA